VSCSPTIPPSPAPARGLLRGGRLRLAGGLLALCALFASGCDDGVEEEHARIRQQDLPRVRSLIEEDLARHRKGVASAAERLAPGFQVDDPADRVAQLRTGLRFVKTPPRGVDELIASPMSFLAAVGPDGKVIARGAEPDTLAGIDFGARYPVVWEALRGEAGVGLGEFEPIDGQGESSWSILFAAPATQEGDVVGAVVAGIPLWRLAQRLSTQLRLENTKPAGTVVWVLTTKGDRLFAPQSGIELTGDLPDGPARAKGLAEHPDGFLGRIKSYGRSYAYGVYAAPALPGDDLGFIIVRSTGDG